MVGRAVIVDEPGCGNMKPDDVGLADDPVCVADAERVPVQTAPVGQHAMRLASSRVQIVSGWQQALRSPRIAQELKPSWQLFCRFSNERTA